MTNEPKAPDEAPQPQQPDELATLRERVRKLEAGTASHISAWLKASTELESAKIEAETLRANIASYESLSRSITRNSEDLRAENARLREALRIANDHLRVLYPNGLRDGDFVCVTVNTALAQAEVENG